MFTIFYFPGQEKRPEQPVQASASWALELSECQFGRGSKRDREDLRVGQDPPTRSSRLRHSKPSKPVAQNFAQPNFRYVKEHCHLADYTFFILLIVQMTLFKYNFKFLDFGKQYFFLETPPQNSFSGKFVWSSCRNHVQYQGPYFETAIFLASILCPSKRPPSSIVPGPGLVPDCRVLRL